MSTIATPIGHEASHSVQVYVEPAIERRNLLTTAFRVILALPHLVLVGGPMAAASSWRWQGENGSGYEWSAGGMLGAVAAVCAVLAWFAILFTGRHPQGLWSLAAFYLRWRVRAIAYAMLLRDEYPPFGDASYPAVLDLRPPDAPRDRLTVALRLVLVIPQLLVVWVLAIAWAFTTVVAWFSILLTGRFPAELHRFGIGVLRWTTRVEAYLLLLRDEYPPFSLE